MDMRWYVEFVDAAEGDRIQVDNLTLGNAIRFMTTLAEQEPGRVAIFCTRCPASDNSLCPHDVPRVLTTEIVDVHIRPSSLNVH